MKRFSIYITLSFLLFNFKGTANNTEPLAYLLAVCQQLNNNMIPADPGKLHHIQYDIEVQYQNGAQEQVSFDTYFSKFQMRMINDDMQIYQDTAQRIYVYPRQRVIALGHSQYKEAVNGQLPMLFELQDSLFMNAAITELDAEKGRRSFALRLNKDWEASLKLQEITFTIDEKKNQLSSVIMHYPDYHAVKSVAFRFNTFDYDADAFAPNAPIQNLIFDQNGKVVSKFQHFQFIQLQTP